MADEYEVKAKVVTVTPAIAKKWLATMVTNRTLSEGRAVQYADLMSAGQWRVTNEGIGFDENGRLVDGQHRLRAVQISGIPTRMLVVGNMAWGDGELMGCINEGKARNPGDFFGMRGVTGPAHKAAVARAFVVIQSMTLGRINRLRMWEVYKIFQREIDWGAEIYAIPLMRQQAVGGALAFAHATAPRKVEAFAEMVISGEGLSRTDPAYHLREMLIRRSGSGMFEKFGKTLNACRTFIEGQPMGVLRSPSDYGRPFFLKAIEARLAKN